MTYIYTVTIHRRSVAYLLMSDLHFICTGDQEARCDRHLPALHLQLRRRRGLTGQGGWQRFDWPGESQLYEQSCLALSPRVAGDGDRQE